MATAWCQLCGAEYVAGVLECVDCLVPLGSERPLRPDEVGGPDDEQLAYELESLGPAERLVLSGRLARRGIAYAWDGDCLVVALDDETDVDALVDDSAREAVLADPASVAFDLDDWTDASLGELRAALDSAGLEFVIEDGVLVVHGVDEERADALIDGIEFPDQLPADDRGNAGEGDGDGGGAEDDGAGGLGAQESMSDLFVAADRLMHDPEDHEGVLSVVDATARASRLRLPYGFAPAVWRDVVSQAEALCEAIETDADDDTVMAAAATLRATLRPLV